jgi:hypothetical protein
MSNGNPRIRLRLSSGVRAIVQQAQGDGAEATAIRALLLLGAARAGLDINSALREVTLTQYEPLHPAVVAALQRIPREAAAGAAATPAAAPAATLDEPPADETPKPDLFSFGIDV